MRKYLDKILLAGSLFALSGLFPMHAPYVSLCLFGEPEFPTEE